MSNDISNTIRDFVVTVESGNRDEIVSAYSVLSQGDKARARNSVSNAMKAAMRNGDFDTAKGLMEIGESLVSVKAEKAETDLNAVLANRISTLRFAADQIANGEIVPDGIDVSKVDYDAISSLIASGEIDAESVRANGDKMAAQKVSRNAARRDVAAHIESALSGVESGTEVLVSTIHNHRSDAYGPDDAPSSGAISARFEAWTKSDTLPAYVAKWGKSDTLGKMVATVA